MDAKNDRHHLALFASGVAAMLLISLIPWTV